MNAPTCIECGSANTVNVGGKAIYPHRPDLYEKRFWLCACGAYCGCHPGTKDALGSPCGPETRKARSAFHAAFDPHWRNKHKGARREAYRRLAADLGITEDECHGGMFSKDRAESALAAVRLWA